MFKRHIGDTIGWSIIKISRGKCNLPAEATSDALIMAYHFVALEDRVSTAQYADRVTGMGTRFTVVGQAFKEEEKIRTLLRGLPSQLAGFEASFDQ